MDTENKGRQANHFDALTNDQNYGLRWLGTAVIYRGVEDYKRAISRHNRLVKGRMTLSNKVSLYLNNSKMQEIERFFRSELFRFYCNECIDGERIIDKIKKSQGYIECPIISDRDYKNILSGRYKRRGKEN